MDNPKNQPTMIKQNRTNEIHQDSDRPVISCKMGIAEANRIRKIIYDVMGTTPNEFLKLMCEVVIRYTSRDHNLTPEMEQCMSLFEHLVGWKDIVMACDPGKGREVQKALYFVGEPKKRGTCAILVERPFMGKWGSIDSKQTENIVTIFERVMELLMPERYRRMRMLAVDMDCRNQVELLDRLIDEHSKETELAEYRRPFEDNDRSTYGIKPNQAPYRRKRNRNMETMFKPIHFKAEDTPEDNSDY